MFTFPKNILLNFALAKPRTLGFTLQELFENLYNDTYAAYRYLIV